MASVKWQPDISITTLAHCFEFPSSLETKESFHSFFILHWGSVEVDLEELLHPSTHHGISHQYNYCTLIFETRRIVEKAVHEYQAPPCTRFARRASQQDIQGIVVESKAFTALSNKTTALHRECFAAKRTTKGRNSLPVQCILQTGDIEAQIAALIGPFSPSLQAGRRRRES